MTAKEAAIAEIRRQRAVGQALDLQAQLDTVRGGALVVPEAIAQGDLTKLAMARWARATAFLEDLAANAPSLRVRLKAADALAGRSLELLALIAANGAAANNVVNAPQVTAGAENVLTREQACEVLQLRRKAAGRTG